MSDTHLHSARVRCSTCSTDIDVDAGYWRCSVASCNAGRLKMRFCSRRCFERHVPTARHRRAEAVEERAA